MNIIDELGIEHFLFTARPNPIPGDRRLQWRSAVLILVLSTVSRAKTATLLKLHVFNWGLRTPETSLKLVSTLKGELEPSTVIVRFDPGLTRVLAFLEGVGLVERVVGAKYRLTISGEKIAETLKSKTNLLQNEKKVLSDLTINQASERAISGLFSRNFIL